MLPALPNAPLCLILVLASVRHRCQINEDHFIWAIASKSKHKDNAIMEWINAETSKACGEMSNQLDKFSELAIFDPIEEAVFDPMEEAADTMFDAFQGSNSTFASSEEPPSPRTIAEHTAGILKKSRYVSSEMPTRKTKVTTLGSGETDKKREHDLKVLKMKQAHDNKSSIQVPIQESGEREGVEASIATSTTSKTTKAKISGKEVVIEEYSVPLPNEGAAKKKEPAIRGVNTSNKKLKASSATETKLNRDITTPKTRVITTYRVTKGLKTHRHMINNGNAFVASNKKPIGSSTVKTSPMKTKNKKQTETREAEEEDASQKTAPTDNTMSPIHGSIQEIGEREGVDEISTKQIYNQAVNGLTAAFTMAGEDFSLIGLALTETNTAQSLNSLIKS